MKLTKKQTSWKWVALAAALGCTALLGGCAQEAEAFAGKSWTSPAAAVENVNIEVQDRRVELAEAQDGEIRVEYAENSKEFYTLAVDGEKTLNIRLETAKGWGDYIGFKPKAEDRVLRVYLPGGLLKNLAVSTSNENLTLPGIAFGGSVTLKVNNGSIQLEGLNVGQAASLEAKNGSITGTVAGAEAEYTISCQTKKGNSNLPEAHGKGEKRLDLVTNNGDVQVEFAG